MKRSFAGVGLLLGIGAAIMVVAVAAAQASSPTPSPSVQDTPANLETRYKEELANQLGISVDQLNTALTNTDNSLIDQAVADGKLTQSEADTLKGRISDDNNLFPFPGLRRGIDMRLKHGLVEESATVLGVDPSVVTDGLKNGQSLAQIANANGKNTADFETALLAQVKSDLGSRVADGTITQAQSDRIYNALSNHIDDIVNHVPGDGAGFHFEFGSGHGGPHFRWSGSNGNGDSPEATPAPSGGTGAIF